jgi:hypothetical protein
MSAVHHLPPFAAPDEVWLVVKGEDTTTICDSNGVTVATTTDDDDAQLIALVPDMTALLKELLEPSAFDGKGDNESDLRWQARLQHRLALFSRRAREILLDAGVLS